MRHGLHMIGGLAWLATAIGPAWAQGTAVPGPAASTVLIFDGSGSMWGKLTGERKIKLDQARDAVRAALAKLAAQPGPFGLISFGHRRASDCSDVQVIVTPEAVSSTPVIDRIMAPLDKLNPRGKGPLTAALRAAATVLGSLPAPRHIVMLHDDPDNCQADPCDALAELQQTAPGVVISVIGLGLRPEDADRYQCLTEPTGGRHFNAQTGEQIAAGVDEAIQLATKTGTLAASSQPKPMVTAAPAATIVGAATTAAIATPVELVRTGPPALRLRALLVGDRLPLGHPVHWSVFAAGAAADAPALAQADGIDAVIALPAADYRVRATAGLIEAEASVTAASEGQTLAEITFNAAEVLLKSPLPGDATLIISARDADAKPAAKAANMAPTLSQRIGLWPPGQNRLLVPAGPLWLQMEQGELRTKWSIEMAAGEARELDAAQAGGRVDLVLAPSAGPAIAGAGPFANQPVVFTLEEDDPDAPRGRREIARSAAIAPEFVVSPGVYMVAASRGTLESRERISVAAGEVVRLALPLTAARLVLGARFGAGSAVPAGDTSRDTFRLTQLETDAEQPITLPGPAAIADVPPGRYRIEARRNNAEIKAEQIVEIKAGEYRAVTLEYQAGELHMDVPAGADPVGEPLFWRVADAAGRLVWSGSDGQASTLLQAGHYVVVWTTQGQRHEQAVDVGAGTVSRVRLMIQP